jgi:hypothetical protein
MLQAAGAARGTVADGEELARAQHQMNPTGLR